MHFPVNILTGLKPACFYNPHFCFCTGQIFSLLIRQEIVSKDLCLSPPTVILSGGT